MKIYSDGKNDNCYTPSYAIYPILKYIDKYKIIWCPFDTEDSQYVKILKLEGFTVVNSHIDLGQDFYSYEPKEWDIIISNPPFTNKKCIFERCLSFGKPFALIMTNTWLNDATPKRLFKDKDLQLLMFDKRIEFVDKEGKTMGRPNFSSSYFCYDFLPKQIIMEFIEG